jgi:RNA polymerase sigma-70 factor (ECF subfamily)
LASGDADHVLVDQVRKGDLTAFEALVEKYKRPIINFASRLLDDPIEAQDVAQGVFVQVFRKAGRFRFQGRLSTWLYTIARNLCLNEHRRRLRHKTEAFDWADWSRTWRPRFEDLGQANASEAIFERELQQKIVESLALLPEKQRTAILLLQEQDLSYEEVAIVLSTSVSATRALIHRGRQELKRLLRPYLRTGAWPVKPQSARVPESKAASGSVAEGLDYWSAAAEVGIGDDSRCAPLTVT